MKRVFAFLPALCLLLTLCACGSKLTPPAPALTPTPAAPVAPPIPETPVPAGSSDAPPPGPSDGPDAPRPVVPIGGDAPVSSLPAPYFFMVAMGEAHSADFDGDGAVETVCVTLEPGEFSPQLCITLDGEPLTDGDRQDETLYTLSSYDFYEPAYGIADLDTTDGLLEIAIQDWGPSDDLTTRFFRIENGRLRDLGSVAGMLWTGNTTSGIRLSGSGWISSYIRLNVLHTWFAPCNYELDGEGVLAPIPQAVYYSPVTVQTLCKLTAYSYPSSETSVLPAGTLLRIVNTDNREWLQADFLDQERFGYGSVWLRLIDCYSLETPDGPVNGGDALLGLSFYD